MSLRGGRQVGVYSGSRSRRGERDQTKMSSESPEVGGKSMKRRKTQERSDSTTSRDSGKGLERDGKGDSFRRGKDFAEKVTREPANDGVGKVGPLIAQMEENTVALRMVIRSGRFCARCEERATGAASLAARHLEEAGSALREYDLRCQQAMKDLDKERREKKGWEEESEEWMERGDRLIDENEVLETWAKSAEEKSKELEERMRGMAEERKELERKVEEMIAKNEDRKERLRRKNEKIQELELERDQLRAALATREEGGVGGGTPPPRDVEPEGMELGGISPPPPAKPSSRPF